MARFNTYIDIDNEKIYFTLDVGKRSKLSLCFRQGELFVRVPYGCQKKEIEHFIKENLSWIKKNIEKSACKKGLPVTYDNGERIVLMGHELEISYKAADKYHNPEIINGKLVVYVNKDYSKEYVIKQINDFIINLGNEAIKSAMERMIAVTGLKPTQITIKNMSASWGRCISNGHISINFNLVTHPIEHIEYVCVHELCHLVYMNHSKDFWALVEKYCPNWKSIREDMK